MRMNTSWTGRNAGLGGESRRQFPWKGKDHLWILFTLSVTADSAISGAVNPQYSNFLQKHRLETKTLTLSSFETKLLDVITCPEATGTTFRHAVKETQLNWTYSVQTFSCQYLNFKVIFQTNIENTGWFRNKTLSPWHSNRSPNLSAANSETILTTSVWWCKTQTLNSYRELQFSIIPPPLQG